MSGIRAQPDSNPFAQVELFAELPEAMLAVLARESRVRRYPEGQVLFSEGDPGDSLVVLEEGRLRISRFTPGGQEVVLATMEAPAAIGELALIDGAPRSATVVAQTPVVVRVLSRQTVAGLIGSEPSVALGMLRAVATMVRDTNERFSDVLSLDVPGRVAKWLLANAARHGQQRGSDIVLPIDSSQSDLALELGTTRVSVNKALKTFEHLGALTVGRNEITIHKRDLLSQYAG
jgi:CRP/FNR family transcriptional regulator